LFVHGKSRRFSESIQRVQPNLNARSRCSVDSAVQSTWPGSRPTAGPRRAGVLPTNWSPILKKNRSPISYNVLDEAGRCGFAPVCSSSIVIVSTPHQQFFCWSATSIETLRVLQGFQYVRAHSGEGLPRQLDPGRNDIESPNPGRQQGVLSPPSVERPHPCCPSRAELE